MELIDHFLSLPRGEDQAKEGVDREDLTRVVGSVGVVKVENGVKFVCLNGEGDAGSVMRADRDGHDHEECNGNFQETLQGNHCVNGNPGNTGQTGALRSFLDEVLYA